MAFATTTERSLCNKLVIDFGGLITPINASRATVMGHASSLDSQLRSMAWSGTSAINNGIYTLNNTIDTAIPGTSITDMQALKTFLDNCAYLNGANPVGAILNAANGIFGLIDDTLNTLAGTVPEFGAGRIAGLINQLLSGLGLPGGDVLSEIFKQADRLINCLTYLCSPYDSYYNPYISTYNSQLQSLYTSMNIVSDPLDSNWGLFDYDSLYSSVGLTADQISDMNLVVDAVDTVKSNSMTGVMDSIASVRNLLKEGDFFA